MTVQILKSQIKDEAAFRAALEALRDAKIDHMMNGEIGTSPPSDAILDRFITRTPTGPDTPDCIAIIDYEIVNDDPPPPSEEEVRARALAALQAEEMAEIQKVLPQNKTRLLQMEVQRALQVEADQRTPEQDQVIASWADLQKRIDEIQYAYAKREAEL